MDDKGYMLRLIKGASLEKFKQAAEAAHERSGKNRGYIFADMLNCMLRYGAGYYDYLIFGFYDLSGKQRKTYVTRLFSKKFTEFMNSPKYRHIFDNKDEFYETFREYLGRDFLILKKSSDDDIANFAKDKDRLFGKISGGECGRGCALVETKDFLSEKNLTEYLKRNFDIVEEVIVQHPSLNEFYPKAVNSMRVITAVDSFKKAHCLYAAQKFGSNGKVVDNNSMFAPVDTETGLINMPAHSGDTVKGQVYDIHPNSAKAFSGFCVPYAKQAKELCLKAALVVPEMRYIGWDVAITPKGPVIIEGNHFSAHDFWQLPPHTPDKTGMIPKIKEVVPEFFEKEGKRWR